MDVTTTIGLESTSTMEQIIHDAGPAISMPYKNSPLDFLGPHDWTITLLWKFNVNILCRLGLVRRIPRVWPAQRLTSFNFPMLSRTPAVFILFFGMAYCAIFLTAWNFEFPSRIEALLWRICTSVVLGLTPIVGMVEIISLKAGRKPSIEEAGQEIFESTAHTKPWPSGDSTWKEEKDQRTVSKLSRSTRADLLRPVLPLRALLFTEPIAAVYTACRVFILVEDIIGLRALPASTFQNVNWTTYWPHF
jgi:hypothetical protein